MSERNGEPTGPGPRPRNSIHAQMAAVLPFEDAADHSVAAQWFTSIDQSMIAGLSLLLYFLKLNMLIKFINMKL